MSLTTVLPISAGLPVLPVFKTGPRYSGNQSFQLTRSPLEAAHNQWPWRAFAFASDAGFIAYSAGTPGLKRLAHSAWMLSLPYYAYALAQATNRQALGREMVFQATANGVLPFLGAHLGVKLAHSSLPLLLATLKSSLSRLNHTPPSRLRTPWVLLLSSVVLVASTVALNDPVVKRFFRASG